MKTIKVVLLTVAITLIAVLALSTGVISINTTPGEGVAIAPAPTVASVEVVPTIPIESFGETPPTVPAPTVVVASAPVEVDPQQAAVDNSTVVQEPKAAVANELSGSVDSGGGNITIVMGGEPDAGARTQSEVNQEQVVVYPPGDAPAIEPQAILATVSTNCLNIAAGQYLVNNPDDTGGIVATIPKGSILFGTDGGTYTAPQSCSIGVSSVEYCGTATNPVTLESGLYLVLPVSVWGIGVYVEPLGGICPQ